MAKKRKLTRKQKQAFELIEQPEANIELIEQPETNFETNEQPETNLETNEQLETNLETNEQPETNLETNEQHEIENIAMENEIGIQHLDENPVKKKKLRGPTKMKRLPLDPVSRINVEFNENAIPIGEGSIKLSSYLGPLVREHVPVTVDDWRSIGDDLKFVLWSSIQARFRLDEEWQKVCIFQQMGCIWRASKSRLVSQLLKAKNIEERIKLKPDNVKNMKDWRDFIKKKTDSKFKEQSDQFKAIRRVQVPHTVSRKGMARLAEDMRKEGGDKISISRAQIWIKSRTRRNGEAVNTDVVDTIEKVKKIESELQSNSISSSLREDAISQVLGQDRPGRLRAMGRGANYTKSLLLQAKDVRISLLEEEVHMLKKTLVNGCRREESTSQSNCGKTYEKCDLVDWNGTDDIVAEGRVVSSDPKELVQRIPLRPNAKIVLIEFPRKLDAFLWRPVFNKIHTEDVAGMLIAWPADKVIVRELDQFDNMSKTSITDTSCKLDDWIGGEELVAEGRLYSSDPNQLVNGIPLGPSAMLVSIDNPMNHDAYLWRPTNGIIHVGEAVGNKVARPESKVVVDKAKAASFVSSQVNVTTSHLSGRPTSKSKCKLIDVGGTGEIVAEGVVASTDPNELVHFVQLGRDAVKVWVVNATIPDPVLWRSTSDLICIEDAVDTTVAWPAAKVITESSSSNHC